MDTLIDRLAKTAAEKRAYQGNMGGAGGSYGHPGMGGMYGMGMGGYGNPYIGGGYGGMGMGGYGMGGYGGMGGMGGGFPMMRMHQSPWGSSFSGMDPGFRQHAGNLLDLRNEQMRQANPQAVTGANERAFGVTQASNDRQDPEMLKSDVRLKTNNRIADEMQRLQTLINEEKTKQQDLINTAGKSITEANAGAAARNSDSMAKLHQAAQAPGAGALTRFGGLVADYTGGGDRARAQLAAEATARSTQENMGSQLAESRKNMDLLNEQYKKWQAQQEGTLPGLNRQAEELTDINNRRARQSTEYTGKVQNQNLETGGEANKAGLEAAKPPMAPPTPPVVAPKAPVVAAPPKGAEKPACAPEVHLPMGLDRLSNIAARRMLEKVAYVPGYERKPIEGKTGEKSASIAERLAKAAADEAFFHQELVPQLAKQKALLGGSAQPTANTVATDAAAALADKLKLQMGAPPAIAPGIGDSEATRAALARALRLSSTAKPYGKPGMK